VASTQPTGGNQTFSLNARENAEAYLMWNTTGFGANGAGVNTYRVYVNVIVPDTNNVLNPPEKACTDVPCENNAAIETIVDAGQNKEGWALIAVAAPQVNLLGASEGNGTATPTGGMLSTDPTDTGTQKAKVLAAAAPSPVIAYLHRPLHMRITAFSNTISTIHGYVNILDGKPGAKNTRTIAGKTLFGLQPEGSSAWFDWTPLTKGPHHLYAVTLSSNGSRTLGELIVQVRRAPGDLNGEGRVDRHDLSILQRDLGKSVAESACGEECDLDGDGVITQKDANLMAQLCDSPDCAFANIEYLGGVSSPLEPDMRAARSADQGATSAFLADSPEDAKLLGSAKEQVSTAQLYQTELQRKRGLRTVRYYYRGKPVTAGPYAQWLGASANTAKSGN
ncbi:MAG: hypothetical protein JO061_04190, partial [Acidobacteriaceae bacterium]|nr:hypothetical protein [Acidobacteriaceae bacterium]